MCATNEARVRDELLAQVQIAHAQAHSQGRHPVALKVTLCDVDLPAFVSDGQLYVQAPLQRIFEAFAEDLSAFLGDMEVRISAETGRGALPLDRHWCPVSGAPVAIPCVVRGCGEW